MKKLLNTLIIVLSISGSFAQVANLPGSGNALNFDGNDWVSVGNSASLKPPSALTVEVWVKPTSFWAAGGDATEIFAFTNNDSWRYGYGLHFLGSPDYDKPAFSIGDGVSTANAVSSIAIALNEWQHIAGTWDGTTITIYINGISRGTTVSNTLTYAASGTGTVGWGQNYNWSGYFMGNIDEVRIWNYARTQTEIRDNMCKKLIGNEAGLVGYWRFDESSGNTAFDSQLNVVPVNDGTLKP